MPDAGLLGPQTRKRRTLAHKQIREKQWQSFDRQSGVAKERGMKRILILDQIFRRVAAGITKSDAVAEAAVVNGIGKSTIWQWLSSIDGVERHDWWAYLTPAFRGGGRRAQIDEWILETIAKDYLRTERPSWAECVRRLQTAASERGIALPHPRTIWRRFDRKFGHLTIARWRGEELPAWLDARYPTNDR